MSHRLLFLILSLTLCLTPITPLTAQSILLPDIGDPSSVYFGADDEQKLGLEIMRKLRDRDAVLDDARSL